MPTSEQIAQHDIERDILQEWSEQGLRPEDEETFRELADEARKAREDDGTVAMEAARAAKDARKTIADEREAQADTHWQSNPDARQ